MANDTMRAMNYRKGSWTPTALLTTPPSSSHTEQFRKRILYRTFKLSNLDRVNVLGDGEGYGHTGCVNALSWAQDGNILLSGGDDTTIRIWRLDTSDTAHEYPFVCNSVIQSGHSGNIFSVQMLPHSSRIATAAGDMQVRVFDVKTAIASAQAVPDRLETEYSVNQSCIRILSCHEQRVKRVITEDSPALFLSISEDGTVRQHDLRTYHNCRTETCPAPLVEIGHSLSTLAISPLTPHQFVVAGDGPYGYLYDRRYLRQIIESEWGAFPRAGQEATTCIRKFGRSTEHTTQWRDHITGSRMSRSNGHEVILSYSGDGVYIFSTHDEPEIKDDASPSLQSMVPSVKESASFDARDVDTDEPITFEESPLSFLDDAFDVHGPNVPTIRPRRRYTGARNVATVKDVNFLGPNDDSVASGSDDGNFFIWDKHNGRLQGIYEGDSSVVNIIEGHPYFPLVAVSGIDNTVKLFGPTYTRSRFSRMDNAEQILETNTRLTNTHVVGYGLGALLMRARSVEIDPDSQCIGQ
ncbi:WD40 repeat-like protein [Phlegmacium glaucopus]|nr:WD40 repeat-like protein [Phlegmacium glaucopus]